MKSAELARTVKAAPLAKGWYATNCPCPTHTRGDRTPSLNFRDGATGIVFKCHAGDSSKAVAEAMAAKLDCRIADFFFDRQGGNPRLQKNAESVTPLTVARLAAAKGLPGELLTSVGVRDHKRGVEIPYFMLDGFRASRSQLRLALEVGKRFEWLGRKSDPIVPYIPALARRQIEGASLSEPRVAFFVEGVSDVWTLMYLDYCAIGLPGAGTARLIQLEHVAEFEVLYLVREPDRGGDAFVAGLYKRLEAIGWDGTTIAISLGESKDVNQLWLDSGCDRVVFAARLDEAIGAGATGSGAEGAARVAPRAAQPKRIDTEVENSPSIHRRYHDRPSLYVERVDPTALERDLAIMTSRMWDMIARTNTPPLPWLLRNGDALVRLQHDDHGRPGFRPATLAVLRHDLAEHIEFLAEAVVRNRRVTRHVAPPNRLVENLLATAEPPVPWCHRIVTTPVFASGGRLIDQPGYDAPAALLYEPPTGFVLSPIAERPTTEEIAAARDALIEPFAEFPYKDRSIGIANTLGALLTVFVRDLISGPTPLHMIVKPVPGAGATLIVRAIGIIVTGAEPTMMPPADDDAEWRKRLTSALLSARQVVVLDNLRTLDSPSLAAALTAGVWEDRLLGVNRLVSIPIRATWLGTGNNVWLTTEQRRRTVLIELDAMSERPWLRHLMGEVTYRHPNLIEWIAAERSRLVASALTIVRGWLAAGCPHGVIAPGSYESWGRTIGGILTVAGIDGFLGNIVDLSGVDETSDIKRLLTAWWEKYGDRPTLTSDLFLLAEDPEVLLPLDSHSEHGRRIKFGRFLDRNRNRVFELISGVAVKLMRPQLARHDNKSAWQLSPLRRCEGERMSASELFASPLARETSTPDGHDVGIVSEPDSLALARTHSRPQDVERHPASCRCNTCDPPDRRAPGHGEGCDCFECVPA